ncbi:MAG: sigma 54-interacting transcriptional regulator [Pseudomonadota bacterium]
MHQTKVIEKSIEYLPVIYLTETMKELYQKGKKSDADNSSIFIAGESGTGKELLAKSIHYNLSPQAQFVTVNCINLPFKHFEEKIENCFSIFSKDDASPADGNSKKRSTLFLRNISKLEPNVQKHLFRHLKEKLIASHTETREISKKIRLIFSCNHHGTPPDEAQELLNKSTNKTFNPFFISILPLRDRKDDIHPLAQFFLDKYSKEYGKDIGGIHGGAMHVLENYPWPGNISELRDVIENAVLLAQSPLITKEDIRFNISKKSIALESFLCREDFFTMEELERIYIQTVFKRVKNNKTKASEILGISRNTLQKKIDFFSAAPAKATSKKKKGNQPLLF